MSITKDQIIEAVAEMSVMQVVELIEAMEEKFGVSAAASNDQNLHAFSSCSFAISAIAWGRITHSASSMTLF